MWLLSGAGPAMLGQAAAAIVNGSRRLPAGQPVPAAPPGGVTALTTRLAFETVTTRALRQRGGWRPTRCREGSPHAAVAMMKELASTDHPAEFVGT